MAYIHILNHYDPENSYPSVKNSLTNETNKGGSTVSLFFNSCSKKCPECFNPETWGRKRSLFRPNSEVAEEVLFALDEFFPKHLALLGGDPLENSFEQDFRNNIDDTTEILKIVKQKRPQTKVICWTGYTWDECMADEKIRKILENNLINILIDGKFEVAKKTEGHLYGSTNQNVINVEESIKLGRMITIPNM